MRLRSPEINAITKSDQARRQSPQRHPPHASHSLYEPAKATSSPSADSRRYSTRVQRPLLVILFTRCKRMTRRQVGSSQKLKSYKENRSRYVPTTLRNPVALVVAVPSKRGNQPATDDRHSRRYFEEGEGKFTQKSPFDTNPAGFAAF